MKRKTCLLTFVSALVLLAFTTNAQTYIYKLNENFLGDVPGAPALVQIPNNSGFTGEFTSRTVPSTTCEEGGTAGGYYFEDNAGLQFNCPAGLFGESYSLSMIFQLDELIAPPSWVRILSFTHTDDHGIYILLTSPPTNGTLEFWPYGTAGETDFFDTENFYQLILVRDVTGLIKVYVNGIEFAEYDDSSTQEYKFHEPDNALIFFRDHPSVLANEASPGFVSNIKITNMVWNSDDVSQEWDDFCSSLLSVSELSKENIPIYPNPVRETLNLRFDKQVRHAEISVIDLTGKIHLQQAINGEQVSVNTSSLPKGLYFLRIQQDRQSSVMKFTKE